MCKSFVYKVVCHDVSGSPFICFFSAAGICLAPSAPTSHPGAEYAVIWVFAHEGSSNACVSSRLATGIEVTQIEKSNMFLFGSSEMAPRTRYFGARTRSSVSNETGEPQRRYRLLPVIEEKLTGCAYKVMLRVRVQGTRTRSFVGFRTR